MCLMLNGCRASLVPGKFHHINHAHVEATFTTAPCSISKIGDTKTTGQVTPGAFTQTIAKAAKERGVEITIATVTELHDNADGTKEVIALTKDGERISFRATDVVFAAGPWTGRLAEQLLGDKAGAAVNIVPRLVSVFPTYTSRVTTYNAWSFTAIVQRPSFYGQRELPGWSRHMPSSRQSRWKMARLVHPRSTLVPTGRCTSAVEPAQPSRYQRRQAT